MDITELKGLVETGNRTIAALQSETKADREKIARIETDLAATLAAKQAAEARNTALENRMNEIEAKAATLQLGAAETKAIDEHKSAVFDYVRSGSHEATTRLSELSKKATDARTLIAASGGYAVPTEVSRTVEKLLRDISPVRSLADVITIGTPDYSEIVDLGGAGAEWVEEAGTRNQTNTPNLAKVNYTGGTLAAKPQATVEMLDDAFFDVEAWLNGALAEKFAEAEGLAFISGDGVNKPKGFLTGTPVSTGDASRAFGTLQYVPTGNAATLGANPIDTLLDLTVALKGGYRAGARFLMSTLVGASLFKLKDADGRPLIQPNLQAGFAPTIHGYGITYAEDMPAVGANAFPIAFGNWKRGYRIADRVGMSIVRDEITSPGFIKLIARKRVFGGVKNSEAVKLLKVSAS